MSGVDHSRQIIRSAGASALGEQADLSPPRWQLAMFALPPKADQISIGCDAKIGSFFVICPDR
jgi:hypothetical protein